MEPDTEAHYPSDDDGAEGKVPEGVGSEDETVSFGRVPRLAAAVEEEAGDEPVSHRDDLAIPDYTLLKRIGSGAYGEVWLAQSVTGALRAVKIVWREDFELTRTFHREFEGIQQFEPISRGHPCLVHILHVGWNEEKGFYYCVMELADDAEKGAQIDDLATYTPRTLGSDLKRSGRLDLHFCREAGIYLADALHYMHSHGLAHRDIKPSNIIFVGGVCKLADIGLVAATGERSFVGTEGFVPPEGPGTPVADVYSLGKVLYEMSSGNDRMEFPEVPADLTEDEWPLWMDLNRVICKACAPDLKERFETAERFAHALQHVGAKRAEPLLPRVFRLAFLTVTSSLLLAAALVFAKQQESWTYEVAAPGRPEGSAQKVGPQQPEAARPWRSRSGRWFSYQKDRHVSDLPLEFEIYNRFLEATLRPFEGDVVGFDAAGGRKLNVVLLKPEDADAFCDWSTEADRRAGYLDADHEYTWQSVRLNRGEATEASRKELTAVRPEIVKVATGGLLLTSVPPGAEVVEGEKVLGETPLHLDAHRAGDFVLELRLPGFKSQVVKGHLPEGEVLEVPTRLRASGAVVFGQKWKNSLGMELVPMGRALLGAHEVRCSDFSVFATKTELEPAHQRQMEQMEAAVGWVSREEAMAFCRWLTDRERGRGLLEEAQAYRLPSDDEWSMAAYLPRELGDTPSARNLRIEGIYPWGFIWPPYVNQGNFADQSFGEADPLRKAVIAEYRDGYVEVAPVGSFRRDSRGLWDLSGNVWEWVADSWDGSGKWEVARGGSYLTHDRRQLLASFRLQLPAGTRRKDVGFRVILAVEGEAAREEE